MGQQMTKRKEKRKDAAYLITIGSSFVNFDGDGDDRIAALVVVATIAVARDVPSALSRAESQDTRWMTLKENNDASAPCQYGSLVFRVGRCSRRQLKQALGWR
jgi:hypothetical protein